MAGRGEVMATAYIGLCKAVVRAFPPSVAFKRRENASASPEMRAALRSAGLGLEPYEVAIGAYFLASVMMAATLLAAVTVLLTLASEGGGVGTGGALLLIMPAAIVPLATLSFMANYPKMAAKRARNQSLGRLPEVVNYIAMSMRLTPALDKAIMFAAQNVEEPMASNLRRVLWNVQMRRHGSVEDSFLNFSYEWGDWNEDFKRSLYAVRGAVLERTEEGLRRGLDKATEIITTGTRQRMEAYVAGLSGPTFVFFTLGVVLPMVFGAMLPMMSIGGVSMGPLQIIVIMNIVFPVATAAYAVSILGNRPGTSTPPEVKALDPRKERAAALRGIIVGIAIGLLCVPPLSHMHPFGLLPILWAFAAGVSVLCLETALARRRERDRMVRLEEEFPDALFQLGSRISEGKPLETALIMTSDSMKATEVSRLFRRISKRLMLTRGTLDEVLFGRDGVLRSLPSPTIKATMRTVNELVKKDAVEAGRAIIGISNHIRDMKRVDRDVRTKLDGVLGMMRTTGIFFAPLIMGITAALYAMMSGVMSGLDLASLGAGGGTGLAFGTGGMQFMDPDLFALAMGTYLVTAVCIILYFVAGMRSPGDDVELRFQLGASLPAAVAIFTLATWSGTLMAGGG